MNADPPPLSAAVLAGGKSRRMGRDKALIPLVDGGPPMLEIVLARVRWVADDVLIVAADREHYQEFGARVIADRIPDAGALGGIHAAITEAAHDHCLVVACDMPFLSPHLLARMVSEPRDYDVLVPRLPGESRQGGGLVFQTLHAIYGKSCLTAIERRIALGNRQVVGFFSDVRVRALDVDELSRFDPSLRSFFNTNTPEALKSAAVAHAEQEHPSPG